MKNRLIVEGLIVALITMGFLTIATLLMAPIWLLVWVITGWNFYIWWFKSLYLILILTGINKLK